MLQDLDPVSVHEVRSKLDKTCQNWRSCRSFGPVRVGFAVEAVRAAGESGTIRSRGAAACDGRRICF